MSETAELIQTEETKASPFDEGKWKSEPSKSIVAEVPDPVIDEKDKQVKEEKPTSDKPAEPEKIPGATPDPVQDRPLNDDPATKKDEPLKFANEESERIFNFLKEGKKDEVYKILAEQQTLASVDKLDPKDVIKLNLEYQNKDFSKEDIADLFNDTYSFPEKPVQDLETDEEEFAVINGKYEKELQKVENRIARDAKPAKAALLKLQQEIVLPDIATGQPKQQEPTQEELEGQRKAKEMFFKDVDESAKTFNGYKTTFKDKEVQIEAAYNVTDEQKTTVKPLIESAYSDLPKFFNEIGWISEEGKPTSKMIEDLHLIQNKETVFSKLASEVGNKRHEASIKSIKNIDYSGKSQSGEVGATPQEKQNKLAEHFFSQ